MLDRIETERDAAVSALEAAILNVDHPIIDVFSRKYASFSSSCAWSSLTRSLVALSFFSWASSRASMGVCDCSRSSSRPSEIDEVDELRQLAADLIERQH